MPLKGPPPPKTSIVYRVTRQILGTAPLVAAHEEDNEEDRQRNSEEPQKSVTTYATSLFREMFNRFHAPESALIGERFYHVARLRPP